MDIPETSRINQRTIYRAVLGVLAFIFIGVCILFAIALSNTWREYQAFEDREATYRQKLADLRAEKAQREAYLRKLLDDPEFLDRVVRERLGYSREDEIIFKFESD
ncbi:septum formation initiator family protein [Rubellicoccus peritrichatus]|uniref:Septum formation initiator family protein n=1 Tax=Rubellicoccus peritrichatus TaxID=3080537 RepID=A0AAQ3LCR3_9BACT|nr:septum formation initiator family protein [Puniceicoccus sp. CR14]WOO42054.1 septum formation initiator family protein [Puniceicoccus sp. CR14]